LPPSRHTWSSTPVRTRSSKRRGDPRASHAPRVTWRRRCIHEEDDSRNNTSGRHDHGRLGRSGPRDACAFARRGASIGLLARGRAGLVGAARDVEDAGGRAVILPADVADADRVEAAAAILEETCGPIDIWINNAMASVFSPIRDMDASEFRRVTE